MEFGTPEKRSVEFSIGFQDATLTYSQLVKTTFLCCKYGVRRLYLVSTTPATPLTKAYQCGFFYV